MQNNSIELLCTSVAASRTLSRAWRPSKQQTGLAEQLCCFCTGPYPTTSGRRREKIYRFISVEALHHARPAPISGCSMASMRWLRDRGQGRVPCRCAVCAGQNAAQRGKTRRRAGPPLAAGVARSWSMSPLKSCVRLILSVVVLGSAACGSSGGAIGAGAGSTGGPVGSACNSQYQQEGCHALNGGANRMVCTANTWQLIESCPSAHYCTEKLDPATTRP